MVGYRNPASLLQCNTYLRRFGESGSTYNLCIDPGSQLDLSVIESNIGKLVGGLADVHGFTINHQDPDVVGNLPYFCAANPKIEITASEETWRLVQHLSIKPGRVRLANETRPRLVSIAPSARLQLVPTPFCHFRGALAFYDPEIRTLFSGDLFGGLNRLGAVHLLATTEDWSGIAQFHQIYMPTRVVLRHAVEQIRALSPPVLVIAPQHGYVITGDLVPLFLERMYELLVGHDLLSDAWSEETRAAYQQVLDQMIDQAELSLGPEEVRRRLRSDADDAFHERVRLTGKTLVLEREGYVAVALAFARLTHDQRFEFTVALRGTILAACAQRELPVPPIGAGLVENVSDVGN
jgi:glyoxylase-like metal-dependent hydrolase (beta-lactamase superfamily II)